jgi:hypothetical protein
MHRLGLRTGGILFGHKKLDDAYKSMLAGSTTDGKVTFQVFRNWYHSRFQGAAV